MTPRRQFAILAPLAIAVAVSSGCSAPAAPTGATQTALEISIEVAPNVLNIQSLGEVVTIHTSLAYGAVVASSVSLNGVTIDSWKADNQGQFVAKFLMTAVKDLPLKIGAMNTIRLEGQTTTSRPFWGSQEILVVDHKAGT